MMNFFTLLVSFLLYFQQLIPSVHSCTPAEQALCKLPYCLCPSLHIPLGFTPAETPQIVYLTFDDSVSKANYDLYEELIFPRKNPNGHPISATFFINHEYTDYTLIHELYRKGHEIALHSITHTQMADYWKILNRTMWEYEVAAQRGQIAHFAKMAKSSIVGFRAPYLQTGGDTMMDVIYDEGLEYDFSRPTKSYMSPGLWPYTGDYNQLLQDCQIEPCSQNPYPGMWMLPMIDYIGDNGEPCAMVDACYPVPRTSAGAFDLLKRNFDRNYNGNKAPFGIFTHAAWLFTHEFDPNDRKAGFIQFLDYLGTLPDVYIVSAARVLEWIRTPTKLADLSSFLPWQHSADLPDNCINKYPCYYRPEDTPFFAPRYMNCCQSCPRRYPWVKNPYGLNQ